MSISNHHDAFTAIYPRQSIMVSVLFTLCTFVAIWIFGKEINWLYIVATSVCSFLLVLLATARTLIIHNGILYSGKSLKNSLIDLSKTEKVRFFVGEPWWKHDDGIYFICGPEMTEDGYQVLVGNFRSAKASQFTEKLKDYVGGS